MGESYLAGVDHEPEVAPEGVRHGSIAVLVPCYNEELTVGKVVSDFRRVMPEAHVYVYDNNSTDATAAIVTDLASRDPHVHLRHEYQQGKGNVIRSMFRDIHADCYVMVDGDDTYPAESCPEMAQMVLEGKADMVIGDRLGGTYFEENKRPLHNTGNRMVRELINWLFGSKINDIMTGQRAFSRRFVKGFPVMSSGFAIETEMTIHAVDKRYLVREIPVGYRDRQEGSVSKLNTFSDGIAVLSTVFNLFRSYRPLRFFGALGILLGFLALVLVAPVLAGYVDSGVVPRFPTLIVATSLGVLSALSFAVGLILDLQVKLHRQLYEVVTSYHWDGR